MSILAFRTGMAATHPQEAVWTDDLFGYRYTGFRGIGRFLDQIADHRVGLISWPGGNLAETDVDRFSLTHDGLFDTSNGRPGLAEMFEIAHAQGRTLSVLLPTARYLGQDDLLRADIRGFMADLLSGHYGPPPTGLIFEIGSEYYVSFPGGIEADSYGHIANIYMEEMGAALNDPAVNLIGLDPQLALQCGRNLAEDELIRDQLSDESLVEVDQLIYHRFLFNATGVDRSADAFHDVRAAWQAEAAELGAAGPGLFLSSYGVGSLTREEALEDFLAADHAAGGHLAAADIDLAGRGTDAFESFWQQELTKRDYGAEHPRMILEMMSEFHAEGMVAASSYGTDMIHPGRLSLTDRHGTAQDFAGQSLMDMMAESVTGTRSLEVNLTNDRSDAVWAYGFENKDKLVIFLSTDGTPPEGVTLHLEGLGSVYRQLWVEGMTASVPQDWMDRFGIADNPNVDESPEAASFAIATRQSITPTIDGTALHVDVAAPHEVIRLCFAKTAAGAEEIAGFSDAPVVALASGWAAEAGSGDAAPQPMATDLALVDLPTVEVDEDAPIPLQDEGDPRGFAAEEGGLLFALMPILFLLGGL